MAACLLLFKAVLRRSFSSNPQKSQTYYDILGITQNATQKDVKTAFYELSQQYHPDKHSGCNEMHDKYVKITEAYDTLSNPKKRYNYNRSLATSAPPQQRQHYTYRAGGAGAANADDFYESFYRRRTASDFTNTGRARGPPPTGKWRHYDFDEFYRMHYGEDAMRHRSYREKRARYYRNRHQWEQFRHGYHGNPTSIGQTFVGFTIMFMLLLIFTNARSTGYSQDIMDEVIRNYPKLNVEHERRKRIAESQQRTSRPPLKD